MVGGPRPGGIKAAGSLQPFGVGACVGPGVVGRSRVGPGGTNVERLRLRFGARSSGQLDRRPAIEPANPPPPSFLTVRAYPNPWRSDRSYPPRITLDRIEDGILPGLFGYEAGALLGRRIEDLLAPSIREPIAQARRRYLDTGQRQMSWTNAQLTGCRADGSELTSRISAGISLSNVKGRT